MDVIYNYDQGFHVNEFSDEIKKHIIDTVSDLAVDFIYYDRKDDEWLPRGALESYIKNEYITIKEIVDLFEAELKKGVSDG